MQRILICAINYRPEMIGCGKYTFELAEHLAARGHSVEVVTAPPHYPGWQAKPPYAAGRYRREVLNGVTIWRCPIYLNAKASGLIRLIMPFTFAFSSAPVLLWRALAKRPDVVLMVQPTIFTGPAALLAAALGGSRSIQHVQDLEIDAAFAVGHVRLPKLATRGLFAIERFVLRRFDRIVTISSQMRQALVRKGVDQDRVTIVRNWIDTDAIRPLTGPSPYRAELGIPDSAFVVQYSGQLGRKQALPIIIDVARALQGDPRFQFVIAGDGPMREELERDTARLPNVRMLPLQPTERMRDFLGLADCHILPQDANVSELVLPSKLGGMLASGRRILVTADQDSELSHFLGAAATFVAPGNAGAAADALRIMVDARDDSAPARLALATQLAGTAVLAEFEREIFGNGRPAA